MFASNVHGYDSLRDLVEGRADNVIAVDFSLSDRFEACAGIPTVAQPVRLTFGM